MRPPDQASDRLRIALISKADALRGGGASRVASRLAELLLREGHEVELHVGRHATPLPPHVRLLHDVGPLTYWNRQLALLSRWLGIPDFLSLELPLFLLRTRLRYDLIHVHDISTAFSPWSVAHLARRLPLIWTFHDCSPFTGGCIHPRECERFKTRCGPCPRFRAPPLHAFLDRTGWMQDQKRRHANAFTAVCPSKWLADQAHASGMFRERPTLIPNAVDTALFRPRDPAPLRHELGLPPDRPVILFCANSFWDPFKGGAEAVEAVRAIRDMNPYLVVAGEAAVPPRYLTEGVDVRFLGLTGNRETLAKFHAAADLLLSPSHAESFGLVVLEAMAAGTPAVVYDVGALGEIVQEGRTGRLVPAGDVLGLAEALRHALSRPELLQEWRRNCAERARDFFGEDVFLRNHLSLYRQVLGRDAAR